MKHLSLSLYVALTLVSLLLTIEARAQHANHSYRYTGDVTVEHMPAQDEVLARAPDNLLLRFTDHVTLVKLVLKTADGDSVNLDFRYNPTPDRVFIWPLPALPDSLWYAVDWGAIDRNNRLMSGQFLFAAGPQARKPSELKPQTEQEHVMVPDYRLINPQNYQPVPAPN